MRVGDVDVYVVEIAQPDSDGTVLFLHGASFTADVWSESGIAAAVADAGIRSVAVDLPGYGRTGATSMTRAEFLEALLEAVTPEGAVVVSPSMSGSFSLDLIASGNGRLVDGFVPVAPVGISRFVLGDGVEAPPTLIVWGSEDDLIDVSEATVLAGKLPGSRIEIIEGAGHAAYLHDPTGFADLLSGFVEGV
jgi:abhydrolase domain-containing protein 14